MGGCVRCVCATHVCIHAPVCIVFICLVFLTAFIVFLFVAKMLWD